MRIINTVLFLFLSVATSWSQLPQTNIFAFDFDENTLTVSNPSFVTSDNLKGYDNQPHFIGDFLYVASQRNKQPTDIYGYNFNDGVVVRMTNTALSEFSPTLMPDGGHFSCVCIEEDGRTQRLWKYPLNMQGKGTVVMDNVFNVGYHTWLNESTVALFVVGAETKEHSIQMVNTKTQEASVIAKNVGRGLQTYDGYLYYIDKRSELDWMIKRLDVTNYDIASVAPTLPKSEDFIVLEGGTLIMGNEASLYKFTPGKDVNWIEIADLSNLGIQKITRLAYSKNKLALVVN